VITKKLGNRLRELREQKGLTQERFALKIGIDRSYYAGVELGQRNISLKNLEKIAHGLDLSLSELFKGVEENGAEKPC